MNDLAEAEPERVAKLTAELDDWRDQLGLPDLDAAIDAPRDMPENVSAEEPRRLSAHSAISVAPTAPD